MDSLVLRASVSRFVSSPLFDTRRQPLASAPGDAAEPSLSGWLVML
jgi:hypothetical protein